MLHYFLSFDAIKLFRKVFPFAHYKDMPKHIIKNELHHAQNTQKHIKTRYYI